MQCFLALLVQVALDRFFVAHIRGPSLSREPGQNQNNSILNLIQTLFEIALIYFDYYCHYIRGIIKVDSLQSQGIQCLHVGRR